MVELFFIACLQVSPAACEERRLSEPPNSDLMRCMAHAQFRLAEWSAANPDRTIARWSCRYAGEGTDEA